jgi:hypothetical protein
MFLDQKRGIFQVLGVAKMWEGNFKDNSMYSFPFHTEGRSAQMTEFYILVSFLLPSGIICVTYDNDVRLFERESRKLLFKISRPSNMDKISVGKNQFLICDHEHLAIYCTKTGQYIILPAVAHIVDV